MNQEATHKTTHVRGPCVQFSPENQTREEKTENFVHEHDSEEVISRNSRMTRSSDSGKHTNKKSDCKSTLSTGEAIPQLTTEYRDLSTLIVKTQECINDILNCQNMDATTHRTNECSSSYCAEQYNEISMLVDCRHSLVSCLGSLLDIKTYLKHICLGNKRRRRKSQLALPMGIHPGDNHPPLRASIPSLIPDGDHYCIMQPSPTSASTLPAICPRCGSMSSVIWLPSHPQPEHSPRPHSHVGIPHSEVAEDDCILICRNRRRSTAPHQITDSLRDITNIKVEINTQMNNNVDFEAPTKPFHNKE